MLLTKAPSDYAAFALAAKLTPEQRTYRAQRAALARYDRPAFEALKANEAKREAVSAPRCRSRTER